MAQVLIRDIDADVIEKLRAKAQSHGRSLESELRVILRAAAEENKAEAVERIRAIRERLAGKAFDDSTALVREDRER